MFDDLNCSCSKEEIIITVYAAFLTEPNKSAWKALREKWQNGESFVLADNLAFIAPKEFTPTTDIAKTVGIGEEENRTGVVFEMGDYTGFNRNDLWE